MENNWLKNNKDQINYYLNSNEVIIVERKRVIKILSDLIRYHFGTKENLNILDLGCGNGVITGYLHDIFPNNNYYLLDGSTEMLEMAKQSLGIDNFKYILKTFDEYINDNSEYFKYDLIFSSNAIHHMDYPGKSKLFSKIFMELKYNGMFLNLDTVLPSSKKSEELQFGMWVDWMNETLENNKMHEDVGKHDNLPSVYKEKPENKPSKLVDQLEMLSKVGFGDVDCFYKYSIFAVFGGIKY